MYFSMQSNFFSTSPQINALLQQSFLNPSSNNIFHSNTRLSLSVQRQVPAPPTLIQVSKPWKPSEKQTFPSSIWVYRSALYPSINTIQLSHKNDFTAVLQQGWHQHGIFQRFAQVNTAYKRVKSKIKSVNLDKSDSSTPEGINDWKQLALTKKTLLNRDPNRSYANWLISKFSFIACRSWLTSE